MVVGQRGRNRRYNDDGNASATVVATGYHPLMVNTRPDAAPGMLESVRALLNTWVIPNDTRVGTDHLSRLSRDAGQWDGALSPLRRPTRRTELEELRRTRDMVRRMVDNPGETADVMPLLRAAADRHPVFMRPDLVLGRLSAEVEPSRPTDPSAVVLAAVLGAARDQTWPRLKSCPDCRWVFYDHTRSATKKWCGMNAIGPNGRACGSISKVRAYRKRQAQGRSDGANDGEE